MVRTRVSRRKVHLVLATNRVAIARLVADAGDTRAKDT